MSSQAPVPPPLLASGRADPVRESGVERILSTDAHGGGSGGGSGGSGGAPKLPEEPDGGDGNDTGSARRYSAGDVVGEVLLLLPDAVFFQLKVEVRATSALVQAYGDIISPSEM